MIAPLFPLGISMVCSLWRVVALMRFVERAGTHKTVCSVSSAIFPLVFNVWMLIEPIPVTGVLVPSATRMYPTLGAENVSNKSLLLHMCAVHPLSNIHATE